ncbi:hypothetical protein ACHAQH_009911, partial [Verticillium albo-atrum]
MTAQEFEMYRRSKMMHQHEVDDDSEYSQDDDDDLSEVDDRQKKQEAFQHRERQQAYIAELRYNRRKVSGGSDGTPGTKLAADSPGVSDASVENWLSTCSKPQPGAEKTNVQPANTAAQDDDDEDVPVGLLMKARGSKIDEAPRKQRSPKSTLHPSMRPHTRASSRQLVIPSPQPRAHARPLMPSPSQTALGHPYGQSVYMNNASASQLSVQRPQMVRPHTSGGLVNRIETLESPSPYNKRRTEQDPWLGPPVNPHRFYGRETPAPQPQYPVMMGNQFFPNQLPQQQYPVMMNSQFFPPQVPQVPQQQYPGMMGGQYVQCISPQAHQYPLLN